ncbi:MAG TPA: calcium-translocating P-type ATPase, SERCA-type [bacterium]|nr:calcium-translocating P-type ATPase, SERCA-type [bacterium]
MEQSWNLPVEEVKKNLATDLDKGLTEAEASERLGKYGPNRLEEKQGRSPFSIFLEQFKSFIIWVLFGAVLVSGFLGEWVDALVIVVIIILNAILGFIQEYKAEKSLYALKKMASPNTKVIRGGKHNVIPSAMLVPGDVVELEPGDHVPADCRIAWHTSNFSVEEASLTGESTPVLKTVSALKERDTPLAERANMIYMGTSVVSGRAKAVVIYTGMNTELGKIAGMIQEIRHESTPLQRKLEEFSKWIVKACFVLVALVFLLEWLRGGEIADVFLTAVSLAVAAIPEGLPAVVTIVLALSVQRMIERNVLIRKLPSVETLGCTTVICSDKTGTLTKNEMTVQAVLAGDDIFNVTGVGYEPKGEYILDGKPVDAASNLRLHQLLKASVLCNGARLVKSGDGYRIVGDPTEAALLTAAAKAGIWKESMEKEFPFIDEIPFDSERKKMTVIRKNNEAVTAFVKGAPEGILEDCSHIENEGKAVSITEKDKQKILESNVQFADSAMRVLAVAMRDVDKSTGSYESELVEKNLTFLGLIAMIDPPRPEVKDAVSMCRQAGIRSVMITGDHKNTGIAIARELGLFREGSLAYSGEELDGLDDGQLMDKIEDISVYARVSSEHKLRVVRAWRRKEQIVAMTGDGVNDAPAVKEADIGVAMGITGTDVTKEVSDMVVTDDNFASIVSAIEEGRGIYDNIRKFVHYLLSCNTGEILVMFTAALAGMPVPLLPIHILWVNLVTDGLPALALGVDPIEPGIMSRKPRKPGEPVVTRQRAMLMLLQGAFIAVCSLLAFIFVLYVEGKGLGRARTAAFVVLACAQLFHAFNCRSMKISVFKLGIFSNLKLVLAVSVSFILQVTVVYFAFGRKIFKTEPLEVFEWLIIIVISTFPLLAMEICKYFFRKRKVHIE